MASLSPIQEQSPARRISSSSFEIDLSTAEHRPLHEDSIDDPVAQITNGSMLAHEEQFQLVPSGFKRGKDILIKKKTPDNIIRSV